MIVIYRVGIKMVVLPSVKKEDQKKEKTTVPSHVGKNSFQPLSMSLDPDIVFGTIETVMDNEIYV